VVVVSIGAGWTWAYLSLPVSVQTTHCEELATADASTLLARRPSIRMRERTAEDDTLRMELKRAIRMIQRLLKLAVVFTPVVALYPLHWIMSRTRMAYLALTATGETITDAHELALQALMGNDKNSFYVGWYYRLCLYCVEASGAACIKIMQWAGSRPDMFGRDFCAVFSKLQDSTRPHSWKHTEQAMVDAFGKDWKSKISLGEILGSGCIAQVYKGVIFEKDEESGTLEESPVAVKVRHPSVEDDIDADLDIMRLSIHLLENFGPVKELKWLNLPGFIEEMAIMLRTQLDLRKEGEHLVQFNKNFEGNPCVVFPKLIKGFDPTERVLCETFCDGKPLMEFVRENKADQKLLTNMCKEAVKAVCQMIFLDNFTHGDLHPGNVMVTDDYKFVLLDVGITTSHEEKDHRLISDVLASFIRKDGRTAAMHMVDSSNDMLKSAGDKAVDEEEFFKKIELVTIAASGKDYFMQKLGTYISYICDAASTHHVMLNQAFISMALAVKVQEGIALALDPAVECAKIAIPIILEGERRNGRLGERAKELLPTFDDVRYWLTGEKVIRYSVSSEDDPKGQHRVVVYKDNQ